MNVFILNTGRCGSTTFIKVCSHLTNYTSGHETNVKIVGYGRLNYPENHIEADNRLSWFLGGLDRKYGNNAIYVHLVRSAHYVIESFSKRIGSPKSIINAYSSSIIMGANTDNKLFLCRDYIKTVTQNIQLFLKDKDKKMLFSIEHYDVHLPIFWDLIKAEGDFNLAMREFETHYNASGGIG